MIFKKVLWREKYFLVCILFNMIQTNESILILPRGMSNQFQLNCKTYRNRQGRRKT